MTISDVDTEEDVPANIPIELFQGNNLIIQSQCGKALQFNRHFAAELTRLSQRFNVFAAQV